MGETLYRKIGRRYEPVAWCGDSESWPEGITLVVVTREEGCRSMRAVRIRQDVNASVMGTIMRFKSELYRLLRRAQEPRLGEAVLGGIPGKPVKLTKRQREAVAGFLKAFSRESITIEYPRFEEVVGEAVDAVLGDAG